MARPGLHPNPIDPHAAVGGLVEAFEEILDLSVGVPYRRSPVTTMLVWRLPR
jgi:hypothetical protein